MTIRVRPGRMDRSLRLSALPRAARNRATDQAKTFLVMKKTIEAHLSAGRLKEAVALLPKMRRVLVAKGATAKESEQYNHSLLAVEKTSFSQTRYIGARLIDPSVSRDFALLMVTMDETGILPDHHRRINLDRAEKVLKNAGLFEEADQVLLRRVRIHDLLASGKYSDFQAAVDRIGGLVVNWDRCGEPMETAVKLFVTIGRELCEIEAGNRQGASSVGWDILNKFFDWAAVFSLAFNGHRRLTFSQRTVAGLRQMVSGLKELEDSLTVDQVELLESLEAAVSRHFAPKRGQETGQGLAGFQAALNRLRSMADPQQRIEDVRTLMAQYTRLEQLAGSGVPQLLSVDQSRYPERIRALMGIAAEAYLEQASLPGLELMAKAEKLREAAACCSLAGDKDLAEELIQQAEEISVRDLSSPPE